MATRADVFPSKHLSAGDLSRHPQGITLVIDRVAFEQVGKDKDNRAVLYFKGAQKGLILNKTNWTRIEQSTGQRDTDFWPGWAVTLYPTTTTYEGKEVDAIRIKPGATPPAGFVQPAQGGQTSGGFNPAGAFGNGGVLDSATIPQQTANVPQSGAPISDDQIPF